MYNQLASKYYSLLLCIVRLFDTNMTMCMMCTVSRLAHVNELRHVDLIYIKYLRSRNATFLSIFFFTFENYTYRLSSTELDEKINITHMLTSNCLQPVGLAYNKRHGEGSKQTLFKKGSLSCLLQHLTKLEPLIGKDGTDLLT